MNYQKIIEELEAEKNDYCNGAIDSLSDAARIRGYQAATAKAIQIVRKHAEGEDKQDKINNTQHEMD